jgi:MerR family transcriptional regulator, light-induced transcriptional regulator
VKRWADDGLIHSEKTAGGHRRFSIHSIAKLRRENALSHTSPAPVHKRSGRTLPSPESFRDVLLKGDESEAAAALIDAYLNHQTLVSLFDNTIHGAMRDIGDQWFIGHLSIADEHRATRVALNALQKLRTVIVPGETTGCKAICCGIEGDLHELPVHMAEILLESEGWDALNLGPNTPLFALREMVTHERPKLISLSCRTLGDPDRAVLEFGQLRKVADKLGAAIQLGGEGFRDMKLRTRFPSDMYANNFADLAKFARAVAKRNT